MKEEVGTWLHLQWIAFKWYVIGHCTAFLFHLALWLFKRKKMSTPQPTNQAIAQANTIIKDIENMVVPIVENAVISACPTLGAPVVKQISEAVEQALADKLTKYLETGADFEVIDLQTGAEKDEISSELAAVIAAEKSGDPNAIQQAIAAYQKAQSALVNDDGSGSPQ